MAYRFLVACHKGGTGKTGEVCGVAYELARRGYSVGIADMDPQGNATRRFGISDDLKRQLVMSGNLGIAAALDPDEPADPFTIEGTCRWDVPDAGRIALLPSVLAGPLVKRGKEAGEPGAHARLRDALDQWDATRHVTLIDSGPNLGHLFDMCLAATDFVLLVTDSEYDGVKASKEVLAYVRANARKLGRPDVQVVGVVVSRFDMDSATHRANLAGIAQALPGVDQWATVPQRLSWSSALNDARPITTISHTAGRELEAVFSEHAGRIITRIKGDAK